MAKTAEWTKGGEVMVKARAKAKWTPGAMLGSHGSTRIRVTGRVTAEQVEAAQGWEKFILSFFHQTKILIPYRADEIVLVGWFKHKWETDEKKKTCRKCSKLDIAKGSGPFGVGGAYVEGTRALGTVTVTLPGESPLPKTVEDRSGSFK